MKIQNKLALISKKESEKIISDKYIDYLNNKDVSEKNVDSKVKSIFIDHLGYSESEALLAVKSIPNRDITIPSKTANANGHGELDCIILEDNKIKVIIEDKKPSESVNKAMDEAIFYANGLNKKGEDVRVAIGFNGLELKLRVLDHTSNKWVPFYINGVELSSFPGKKLLDIIYHQKDIHGILVEESKDDINIKDIIGNLKNIYRNIELQNDNQKTIDFTIAFIGLKSVLEKYKLSNIRGLKSWDSLNSKSDPKNNSSEDDEELRDNICYIISKISEKMGAEYDDLFVIKDSENIEQFNFKNTIKTFTTDYDLRCLRNIFIEISKLHDLHDSKIDLFGEVYESLGDKNTKKAFGQYFTRRHIIKSLIDLMEIDINDFIGDLEEKVVRSKVKKVIKSPKRICDPACGTGGFVTEFFKYVLDGVPSNKNYKDIDISELAKKSFYGYDIYTSNVTRTRINMYLSGDGFSEIRKADTLQDKEIKSNYFDFIITNPPYGKGTFKVDFPHLDDNGKIVNKPVINNQRLEVNFLVKIVDMLKPNGKAMVIIPDGILEATTLSPLREWFLKMCRINKIISLPKHAFAPYTHEKTYAIFFEKRSKMLNLVDEAGYDAPIWCYIVDNDGYANSDKRFRTDRMDENGKYIHDEFSQWRSIDGSINDSLLIERYKKKEQSSDDLFYNEWGEVIDGKKYGYISLKDILKDEFVNYKVKSSKDILSLVNKKFSTKFKTVLDILDDESLKPLYKEYLEKMNIEFDYYENRFYDLNDKLVTKTIILSPERYFRQSYNSPVSIEDFKSINKELLNDLKNNLDKFIL